MHSLIIVLPSFKLLITFLVYYYRLLHIIWKLYIQKKKKNYFLHAPHGKFVAPSFLTPLENNSGAAIANHKTFE